MVDVGVCTCLCVMYCYMCDIWVVMCCDDVDDYVPVVVHGCYMIDIYSTCVVMVVELCPVVVLGGYSSVV